MVEITAEEQNKEKRMKKHNIYSCHDCLSETHSPLRVTWDYLSPQFVDAYERLQWKEKNIVFKPLSHPPETLRFQDSTSMVGKPQPALLLLNHFSRVRLCATPSTAAHQAPPSLGCSRQEHWSGLPFPSPRDSKTEVLISTYLLQDLLHRLVGELKCVNNLVNMLRTMPGLQ